MAQAPRHEVEHSEPPTAAKAVDPLAPRPTIGVRGDVLEDGERDPGTIAEEQRIRSAEIEAMGVEAYMAKHSTPVPDEEGRPKRVVAAPPEKISAPHPEPERHSGRR